MLQGVGGGFERKLMNNNVLSVSLNYMDLGAAPVVPDEIDGAGTVTGKFMKRWALDLPYSRRF